MSQTVGYTQPYLQNSSNQAYTLANGFYSDFPQLSELGQAGRFYGLTLDELKQIEKQFDGVESVEEILMKSDLTGIDRTVMARWFSAIKDIITRAMKNEIGRRERE